MADVSTDLFQDRAELYASNRPGYPDAVIERLTSEIVPPARAVDIGAGTGILSQRLRDVGFQVAAVEPNLAMRRQLVARTVNDNLVQVVDGTGEATGLSAACADLITVAQAFHWLNPVAALTEFKRISHRRTLTAIIWNSRQFDASDFMTNYRNMLHAYFPKYGVMRDKYWSHYRERVADFFAHKFDTVEFANNWHISKESFLGNLFSNSYAPKPDESGYAEAAGAAEALFERFQLDGRVTFAQNTIMYTGTLGQT